MGTWGTGILENDIAADAKARFEELISQGSSTGTAVKVILEEQGLDSDKDDDYLDLILALSELAFRQGGVPTGIVTQAQRVISSGKSLTRWSESTDQSQRREVEEDLLKRLNTPPEGRPVSKVERRPRKLPYREGDWVTIPLDDGGMAIGLIARANQKGQLLGYFFGPRRISVPKPEDVESLSPRDAVYVHFCGDPGILTGKWQILFRQGSWNKANWPLPAFGFKDKLMNATYRRFYDEATLKFIRQERVPQTIYDSLPSDGAGSARSVEAYLNHILPV